MDEDDEFGDLYSEVLRPSQPLTVLLPPPLPHRSIDLNFRSQAGETSSPSFSRIAQTVLDLHPSEVRCCDQSFLCTREQSQEQHCKQGKAKISSCGNGV
ncbi:unnamed protein product [Cochlearia groenlandica]